MKISVIGPAYPFKGGISHFTTLLVRNLRRRYRVNFINWTRQYPSFLYPVDPKDTGSRDPIAAANKPILDFLNPLTWLAAFWDIRRDRSDLLYLTWVTPVQAPVYVFIALLVKSFTRTRIRFLCHNVLPHEPHFYDRYLTRAAFYFGDSFVVHSREDRESILKFTKNKKIILAFHPLYDVFNTGQKYHISKIKKDLNLKKHVLLFFGYIRPYKGLKYLLKAMPRIIKNNPGTTLLVVGEFWSKNKTEYFEIVDRLKISRHVVFVDRYVKNEDVGRYFAVSDVLVLPYLSATQSGIVQIAYAFNKPVIASRVGGLKDIIAQGVTGYFIRPQSPQSIARAVAKFFRRPLSAAAISRYKTRFSWAKYASLLESRPVIVNLSSIAVFPPLGGGPSLILNRLKNLAAAADLHLITVKTADPAKLQPGFSVAAILPRNPYLKFLSPLTWWRIIKIIRDVDPDYLIIDFPWYGFIGIYTAIVNGIPFYIRAHNVEFDRFRRFGAGWWPFLKIYEQFVYSRAAKILYLSAPDRDLLIHRLHVNPAILVYSPYIVDRHIFHPDPAGRKLVRRRLKAGDKPLALFFGALDYPPNREAVDLIRRDIAPAVYRRRPDIIFLIVGKNPPPVRAPNILVTGPVLKIGDYINAADVVIVPITSGGGIRTKIVESLACGKRVISTALGAEGITPADPSRLIICRTVSGISDEVIRAFG